MKLVLTMLVHNDAAILEQSLNYHLGHGLSHVVAIDDNSTDGAGEVLKSFERAGGLTLLPRPAGVWGADSSRWRTALARHAATEHKPDWILTGDADEFWWPLEGDLRDAFALVPAQCDLVIAPRHDFVYPPGAEKETLADGLQVREAETALGPKIAFRPYSDVTLDRGSHRAARDPSVDELTKWDSSELLSVSPVVPARIFHYAIRDGDHVKDARRDPLFRFAFEPDTGPTSWESDADWRCRAFARAVANEALLTDTRLADFLQGRSTLSSEPGEMLELQRFVMEAFMRTDNKLRKRTRRLRHALAKEHSQRDRRLQQRVARLARGLLRQ